MTDNQQHSSIGASSAYRWMACPGSVNLIKKLGVVGKTSSYAEEGTKAHDLAEKCLRENIDCDDLAVMTYVNYIRSQYGALGGELLIEEKFNLDWIHPDAYGTSDACIVRKGKELIVIDYKHGAGIAVEVENNSQLLYYALGVARKYDYDFEIVKLVVVQPRANHADGSIRSWRIHMQLLKLFEKKLAKAIAATTKENALLNAGDHCRFCPAASQCPKLLEKAYENAVEEFAPGKTIKLPTPESLTSKELCNVLESATILGHWIKEVQAFALKEAEAGREITGHKLVKKRSIRKWKDEQDAMVLLSDTYNSNMLLTEPKLKSPAQLEKLKIDKELIEELCEKPDTGVTLVPLHDKRAPVTPSAIADFTIY